MPNVVQIPGTSWKSNFPFDANCPKCPQFCCDIDGRFSVGTYHVPALFNPSTSEPLSSALEKHAKATPAGETFEPIIVWRGFVPGKHVTRGVAVEVIKPDETCIADRRCCNSAPDGLCLTAISQVMDLAAYCEAGDCDVNEHLKGTLNVIKTDIDPTEDYWARFALTTTVAPGEVLLFGFRIDVLPDNAEALACIETNVAVTILADNFSHPFQMD